VRISSLVRFWNGSGVGNSNQTVSVSHEVHGTSPRCYLFDFCPSYTVSAGSGGRSLTVSQPIRIQDACSGVCYVGGTYPSPGCREVVPTGFVRFSWQGWVELRGFQPVEEKRIA